MPLFVRGVTNEDGEDCKVTVRYAGQNSPHINSSDEDGSFDLYHHDIFSEIQTRKRTLQIINPETDKYYFFNLTENHLQKS